MKWRFQGQRDHAGIDLLRQMSSELIQSAGTLAEMLGSYTHDYPQLIERLHSHEAANNEQFFRLLTIMRGSLVTRIPREDFYRLGSALNNAVESMDAVGDVLATLQLQETSPRAAELLEAIQRMAENTRTMFLRFDSLDDLEDLWVENLRLAKRASQTHLVWMRDLTDGYQPVTVVRHSLMGQHMLSIISSLRECSLLVGEILVRES